MREACEIMVDPVNITFISIVIDIIEVGIIMLGANWLAQKYPVGKSAQASAGITVGSLVLLLLSSPSCVIGFFYSDQNIVKSVISALFFNHLLNSHAIALLFWMFYTRYNRQKVTFFLAIYFFIINNHPELLILTYFVLICACFVQFLNERENKEKQKNEMKAASPQESGKRTE